LIGRGFIIFPFFNHCLHIGRQWTIKANLDYVGFEIQKESTWTYFEIKNIKQLSQLNVFCEVLFGVNDQQINIFHVNAKGNRKSYELIYPKNTTQFNF